jgi:hypothetical protein
MNPTVKSKWLEALRSGEYSQTKHVLKDDDGFCCLGVLCEVYDKEHGQNNWIAEERVDAPRYKHLDGSYALLPDVVMQWADLNSISPKVSFDTLYNDTALANLNDRGYKFEQIADIIEEKL